MSTAEQQEINLLRSRIVIWKHRLIFSIVTSE